MRPSFNRKGPASSDGGLFCMQMTLISVLLILYIAVREYFVQKERSQLLDRIMSQNLIEYKSISTPEEPDEEVAEDETVPISEAEEEIMGGVNA